ncbi:MAG: hypothetical protein NZ653_00915 [Anaerolineae bacterium]|nr:hypothetical protein [Anaerolineae bacterium]
MERARIRVHEASEESSALDFREYHHEAWKIRRTVSSVLAFHGKTHVPGLIRILASLMTLENIKGAIKVLNRKLKAF